MVSGKSFNNSSGYRSCKDIGKIQDYSQQMTRLDDSEASGQVSPGVLLLW